jgi:hypothetical protein
MLQQLWTLLIIGVACGAQSQEPLRLVRIQAEHPQVLADRLHVLGFDTSHSVSGEGALEFVVSVEEQQRLGKLGLAAETVRVGQPLRQRLDELNGEIPAGYSDWAGILAQMNAAAALRPDICEVIDLTARYGTPPTHEGRHIMAVRISDNVNVDEAEPAVLFVSAHHSREIGTPIVGLTAIENLVNGYGTDSAITAAVDANEIWIAPLWNPDGYEHVYNVDDFWRKNRRDNGDGTIGVDLNRNYPIGWGVCNGSQDTSSQIYEGPIAASEPETQTMVAFAADRQFAKVADIHAFASEIRSGYGCWNHPWDSYIDTIAIEYSIFSGYGGSTAPSCCLGGDIHLHANTNGALSLLWEIGDDFHPTFAEASTEADAVWVALLKLLERPIKLTGRVSDVRNANPVAANIELIGVPFDNGEKHGSAERHGLYHAYPPAGLYTLRFTAPGYTPQEHSVPITGSPKVFDVLLVPNCIADVNNDGVLTPTDFTAWINAFNNNLPECDQNTDGSCTPTDFTAWITNFNTGC